MSSSEAELEEEEEEEEEEEAEDKDDGSYKDDDEGGDDDDDDDDEDNAEEEEAPREDRKRASRKSVVSYAEDNDDDDDDDDDSSDDDMPLAQLAAKMKKKKAPAVAAAANGKKAATKKATSPAKKKKKTTAASPSKSKATTNGSSSGASSNKKYEWASAALYGSNSDKGRLIQEFLRRWWYAYTWPDPKTLPKKTPDNYDCLDGFPGVYVCTAGYEVGKILDKRDASQQPSFANMAKKTADQLQELLLKALERQKEELIQHEGTGTSTEKDITDLIKWTKRVNADKAEREAKKVLQASKIKI